MQKLLVFNQISLDGYIADGRGDMSWAHRSDPEWNEFVANNAKGTEGTLLFGRVTYELMASYWPTPMAKQNAPVVADGMNARRKVVFSRTLQSVSWSNTRLFHGDLAAEVRKLKREPGDGIVLMGSASVVSQLSDERLVDEYQLIVNPIALGAGKSMFAGMKQKLPLKLTRTRTFNNGNVMLCYEPA